MELLWVGLLVLGLIMLVIKFSLPSANLTPEMKDCMDKEKEALRLRRLHGPLNSAMVCPHCQTKGKIRTQHVTQKKGVSGGKATAALLTGGTSLLAVGLSRKEGGTQAMCMECRNTWIF